MKFAGLDQFGVVSVLGDEARPFLHAQVSNDVTHLGGSEARLAGYCTAKGRLLASFLMIGVPEGVLLVLARELAAPVAKRLSMFVLRARARVAEASGDWPVSGVWGSGASAAVSAAAGELSAPFSVGRREGLLAVRLEGERCLLLGPQAAVLGAGAEAGDAEDWWLEEIRAGRPWITQATQDRFVPQMVNLELIGGIDFRKGCYPGQEIVARTQYLGTPKRRLYRLATGALALAPGQDLYADDVEAEPAGMVLNAAGGEALAVLQTASVGAGAAIRSDRGGIALRVLDLPAA